MFHESFHKKLFRFYHSKYLTNKNISIVSRYDLLTYIFTSKPPYLAEL